MYVGPFILGAEGASLAEVIYTTPNYVPEYIYPCGPGTHIARGPEDVRVYVCMHVCVCDHVGTTGSGGQVSWGMVPGPWACLLL